MEYNNERFKIAERRNEEISAIISRHVIKRFGGLEPEGGETQDDRLMRLGKFKKDLGILDLRSGRGWLLDRLFGCGYERLYGIDLDRIKIRSALSTIDSVGGKGMHREDRDSSVSLKTMYNSKLSDYGFLNSDYFDIVISVNMLGYLRNLKKFFSDILRITKENGIVILSVPNNLNSTSEEGFSSRFKIKQFNKETLAQFPFGEDFVIQDNYVKIINDKYEQSFIVLAKKE